MVYIPKHLKECTKVKKSSKDTITLQVLCDCGCSNFYLLENILDAEEENRIKAYEKRLHSWRNIENYTDPITRIGYLVTRNVFGKISDRIPISEISNIERTHIIKVKCAKCDKEKIIYDSRYHGYSAIVNNKPFSSNNKVYRYKLLQKESVEVEIKIRNDLTYDEFCEEVDVSYIKEFSNAFSSIEIYGIKEGKKKKYFEEETA